MNIGTDVQSGDEVLSVDQAAAAYVKAASKEAEPGQSEEEVLTEGETTDEELPEAEAEEGEEADGETEAEDQAEDGEDEPESDQGRFVADNAKVRLSDGSVVTIADLKSGSLRQADYTRKTQEVAEQRKQFETQSSAFQQREAQINQQAELVAELVKAIVPKEPDPSLADPSSPNFDIVAYNHQRAQHEAWSRRIAQFDQQRQQTMQAKQAEQSQATQQRAKAEWEALTAKMPELLEEARVKSFGEKLIAHGKHYGFTEDELKSIVPRDHRFSVMARDAIKWRELQASKPKAQQKVEGRPPIQKGGKRLNPSEAKARQASDALTRLGQTGTLNDAVEAYIALHNR